MITMISKCLKAVGFPNRGSEGFTGVMKIDSNPITGTNYYFQPHYRNATRKDRRK